MANISAVFFDIFGLIAFVVLMFIGVKLLKKKSIHPLISGVIIAIASAGLIIDGFLVIRKYILGG
ncbi:hypothetical protein GF378_00620 [Candidatus Pacearchaeota archaeon]|nr:hypothetical protein [Candidatus Pacearchaeota archaeon]